MNYDTIRLLGSDLTMQNLPVILTEPQNHRTRHMVDLNQYVQGRLQYACSLPTVLVSLGVEYSLDNGIVFASLIAPVAHTGIVDGHTTSGWTDIPEAARKEDIIIRAMAQGNGALDPVFRMICIELRG